MAIALMEDGISFLLLGSESNSIFLNWCPIKALLAGTWSKDSPELRSTGFNSLAGISA